MEKSVFWDRLHGAGQYAKQLANSTRPLVRNRDRQSSQGQDHSEAWKGFSLGKSLLHTSGADVNDSTKFPIDAVYATLAVGLVSLVLSTLSLVILASRSQSCDCSAHPSNLSFPTAVPHNFGPSQDVPSPREPTGVCRDDRDQYGKRFYPSLSSHVYVKDPGTPASPPVYPAGIFYGDLIVVGGSIIHVNSSDNATRGAVRTAEPSSLNVLHLDQEKKESVGWTTRRDVYNVLRGGQCGVNYLRQNYLVYTGAKNCTKKEFNAGRSRCCIHPERCQTPESLCTWTSRAVRLKKELKHEEKIAAKKMREIYDNNDFVKARNLISRPSYYVDASRQLDLIKGESLALVSYEDGKTFDGLVQSEEDPMRADSVMRRNAQTPLPLTLQILDEPLDLSDSSTNAWSVIIRPSIPLQGDFDPVLDEISNNKAVFKDKVLKRRWRMTVVSQGAIPGTSLVEMNGKKYVVTQAKRSKIGYRDKALLKEEKPECVQHCHTAADCFRNPQLNNLVCETNLQNPIFQSCCATCFSAKVYVSC